MKKQFALFGTGRIGAVHARNIALHAQAELAYVYDVFEESARACAQQYGARCAASPEEIWNSDVDAVVIASSTNTHAGLLSAALKAGKAVYCEKPIDLDIGKVRGVVAEARDSELPVFIGFSRRFDGNHRGVYRAIREGSIGDIELMHITSRDLSPPSLEYIQVSGGQFRDQTIHCFDLVRWLTGAEPVEVYACASVLVDKAIGEAGDVDTAMLTLKMPSGALCHINNSRRSAYGYDEYIEVFGSKGMVQSRRKPTAEVSLYSGASVVSSGLHSGWFERMEHTFEIALDTFVRTLLGEGLEYPNASDGLRAQLIAEAAVASLKANKPVSIE